MGGCEEFFEFGDPRTLCQLAGPKDIEHSPLGLLPDVHLRDGDH
jgi:hypothetical protein